MANYIIAGRECIFPSVPYSTLEMYKPNENTHYLAWRADNTALNVHVCTSLDLAYRIGAIMQPATCVSDEVDKRIIYLLQGVSQYWLDTVLFWFRALNIPYMSMCPFYRARVNDLRALDEQIKDDRVKKFVISRKIENLKNGKGAIFE